MAPIAAPLLFLNAFIFPNILFISMESSASLFPNIFGSPCDKLINSSNSLFNISNAAG